jgi:hypothetical protein
LDSVLVEKAINQGRVEMDESSGDCERANTDYYLSVAGFRQIWMRKGCTTAGGKRAENQQRTAGHSTVNYEMFHLEVLQSSSRLYTKVVLRQSIGPVTR